MVVDSMTKSPTRDKTLRIIRLSGLIIGLSRMDVRKERVQYLAEDVHPASQTVDIGCLVKRGKGRADRWHPMSGG
jgi:hypothetical protein